MTPPAGGSPRSTPTTPTGCGCWPGRGPTAADGEARPRRWSGWSSTRSSTRCRAARPRRRAPDRRPTALGSPSGCRRGWPSGSPPSPTSGRSWCGSRCGSRPTRRSWSRARSGWCCRSTTSRTPSTCATPPSCGPSPARARATGSATGPAPTPRIALRAAAEAWPVLDRLLELRVPDQITLDSDELVSLLDHGVARPAASAGSTCSGRAASAATSPSPPSSTGRRAPASSRWRGHVRPRHALRLPLAGRPARRPAHRGGDGPARRGGGADPQAARQLDGHRPVGRPQGPQAPGPHRQARPRRWPPP